MKKIINIVRWIIGIFIILTGLLLTTDSAAAGILLSLSGIIVLPQISKLVPAFKGRKPAFILTWVVLFCAAVVLTPTTTVPQRPSPDNATSAERTANASSEPTKEEAPGEEKVSKEENSEPTKEETPEEEKVSKEETEPKGTTKPAETPKTIEASESAPAGLDAETKAELRTWIDESLDSEKMGFWATRKWSKILEDEFLAVWKDAAAAHIESAEAKVGVSGATEDMKQFKVISFRLEDAIDVYQEIYEDSSAIKELQNYKNQLDQKVSENEKLQEQYAFDMMASAPFSSMFYVTQRLDKAYSDNILGSIQKEIDSYRTQSTSDWVVYNVEYALGTTYPGDSCYVIHADSLNPFSQTGAYEISCVDTGETTDLIDEKGFTSTVPVYQMVESTDSVIADQQTYLENRDLCLGYLKHLNLILDS